MKNQENLMDLMNELIKHRPQNSKIQRLCHDLSIPYNGNQVELMSFILDSAHKMKLTKKTTKKLNHETNQ